MSMPSLYLPPYFNLLCPHSLHIAISICKHPPLPELLPIAPLRSASPLQAVRPTRSAGPLSILVCLLYLFQVRSSPGLSSPFQVRLWFVLPGPHPVSCCPGSCCRRRASPRVLFPPSPSHFMLRTYLVHMARRSPPLHVARLRFQTASSAPRCASSTVARSLVPVVSSPPSPYTVRWSLALSGPFQLHLIFLFQVRWRALLHIPSRSASTPGSFHLSGLYHPVRAPLYPVHLHLCQFTSKHLFLFPVDLWYCLFFV